MIPTQVLTIGDSAYRLCLSAENSPTRVSCVASFQRCLYLATKSENVSGIVCVATAELPRGPLTAIVAPDAFTALQHEFSAATGDWIDGTLTRWLDYRGAALWESCLHSDLLMTPRIRNWLKLLVSHSTAESIFRLCHRAEVSCAVRSSGNDDLTHGSLVSAQRNYFESCLCESRLFIRYLLCDPKIPTGLNAEIGGALIRLAGAGRGMTPAGDDALAGIFLALYLLGHQTAIATLQRSIMPAVSERTHIISNALLAEASAGRVDESMHRFIDNMSQASIATVHQSATLLSRMGQTSGWDCLAGMWLVFDAADGDYPRYLSTVHTSQSTHA